MNDNIINGKYLAENILLELAGKIAAAGEKYKLVPTLAIILVGEDPASIIYVRNKLKAAERIGINAFKVIFPALIDLPTLLLEIEKLNQDKQVSGIIVQLPLPKHIDKNIILSAVDPEKDVDGFNPINVGYLNSGLELGFVPCTALGILHLIKNYEPSISGKNIVIIGRSNIVGRPLLPLLLKEDATVTMCHSKTTNLSTITLGADIVISAMGKAKYLTAKYFNQHSIVIDVGINRDPGTGKIVGDVDFLNVCDKVKYITPVPGGVGPMTIAFLLGNTFKAFLKQNKIEEEIYGRVNSIS